MLNERNYHLDIVPKMLRDRASELESQIRELETQEGSPTETNYDEIQYITASIISVANQLAEALKTIAEDANLQAPSSVMGAAGRVNLGYSHTEKDKVTGILLSSAAAVLNSHNRLVNASVAEIADICEKIMKEIN